MTNYKPTGSISACAPDKWKEHSHATGSISACAPDKWKEHSHATGSISACAPEHAEYSLDLLKYTTTKTPLFNVKNLEQDKQENWSTVLNRSLTSEEMQEEKLKYVIDTLYVETRGLNLEIHSELVDEKLGLYEMYADVKEGDDFTKFTVSKEDMKFVIDRLCEIKEQTKKEDPKHYTSHPSGIETIEITRWMNFNLGNSIKYILRSGKKSEDTAIQDLEKAIWYINDEIKRLKGEYNK